MGRGLIENTVEQESLCQRCGVSCHAAIVVEGRQVVIEDLHCTHYDKSVGCKVYERRFEVAPWCLHSRIADPLGALRDDCPYRRSRDGRGKMRVGTEEYELLFPKIVEALIAAGPVNFHFTWGKFVEQAAKRGHRLSARKNMGPTARVERDTTMWSKLKLRGLI